MMKQKLKPCKTCGDARYIFSHGNCKDCCMRIKISEKPKFKPLTQTNNGKEGKVFKVIAKVSKKRRAELVIYERNKAEYFKKQSVCEFPGCERTDITLHHRLGRIGSLLTDKRYFCSLCPDHHRFCEENPLEAKRLGLSDSRLEKGVLI